MKRITTLLLTAGILLLSAVPNGAEEGDMKCYDWFFCTRQLPKDRIEDKIYRK